MSFPVGPLSFEVSTAELGLPMELRMGSTIASLPCSGMAACPAGDPVSLTCASGVCDPDAVDVTTTIAVIDFNELIPDDFRDILSHVDRYDIEEITYEIEQNTLTVNLPEVELHWGPEGAIAVDPAMGVHRLTRMPATEAGRTGSGMLALEAAGEAALSDHLVDISQQVRFFARTRVDLAPGGPYPQGSLRASASMRVRAVGSVL